MSKRVKQQCPRCRANTAHHNPRYWVRSIVDNKTLVCAGFCAQDEKEPTDANMNRIFRESRKVNRKEKS